MEDEKIIELYFQRQEQAISETKDKYGTLCRRLAYNILENSEDSDEAVSDTYLRLWNSIPPERPKSLGAYLTTLVRNAALDIYRRKASEKRTNERLSVALDEIAELIPSEISIEDETERRELIGRINSFLKAQPKDRRVLFVRRYYYLDSIKELSESSGLSESYITVTLMRMRKKLTQYLKKEGLL